MCLISTGRKRRKESRFLNSLGSVKKLASYSSSSFLLHFKQNYTVCPKKKKKLYCFFFFKKCSFFFEKLFFFSYFLLCSVFCTLFLLFYLSNVLSLFSFVSFRLCFYMGLKTFLCSWLTNQKKGMTVTFIYKKKKELLN